MVNGLRIASSQDIHGKTYLFSYQVLAPGHPIRTKSFSETRSNSLALWMEDERSIGPLDSVKKEGPKNESIHDRRRSHQLGDTRAEQSRASNCSRANSAEG